MSGPDAELNLKDTRERREDEGDHVRFSGIDEVLNNVHPKLYTILYVHHHIILQLPSWKYFLIRC